MRSLIYLLKMKWNEKSKTSIVFEFAENYCFTQSRKIFHIIRNQSVGMQKECSLKRHFERKHSESKRWQLRNLFLFFILCELYFNLG